MDPNKLMFLITGILTMGVFIAMFIVVNLVMSRIEDIKEFYSKKLSGVIYQQLVFDCRIDRMDGELKLMREYLDMQNDYLNEQIEILEQLSSNIEEDLDIGDPDYVPYDMLLEACSASVRKSQDQLEEITSKFEMPDINTKGDE